MTGRYIAAIDQGTTSSRCMIFDAAGGIVAAAQKPHRQHFAAPGWVEHDAAEIWANVEAVSAQALSAAGAGPGDIAAVGITNQRETSLIWDRASGAPIAPAIVWQDTRTAGVVGELAREGGQDRFRAKTGLPLATYFSGAKIAWLLDHVEGARAAAKAGRLAFGTMDCWLIFKLTGRHLTDVSNASRTQLMDLETLDWDEGLLEAFGVPRALLPQIRPSAEVYGKARGVLEGVAVAAALGDQQAALFGQACFAPGEAKCTYGTGAFLLTNTGTAPAPSKSGLITTVAYKIGEGRACYALEGSIAAAGALVQWLRDNLGLFEAAADIEALAASAPDSGGAVLVPAFSGLFAPHWRADARGVIAGLTHYVTKAHLARAALEAVAFQVREVAEAMAADMAAAGGGGIDLLKADGGMTANALLMQIQADVLGREVARPAIAETTALGAAWAAGLAVGFWPDTETLRAQWREDARWTPAMDAAAREAAYGRWKKGVERTLGWA
ncbi:MAG TPA: glycerol kinase GlpK [Caulobacteraceae bacterium]|nr:glycerol kinase GlpK [Caulobacteraceae bacterium]